MFNNTAANRHLCSTSTSHRDLWHIQHNGFFFLSINISDSWMDVLWLRGCINIKRLLSWTPQNPQQIWGDGTLKAPQEGSVPPQQTCRAACRQAGLKHTGFTAPQKAELTGSQQRNTIIEAQRGEPGRASERVSVWVCVEMGGGTD